MVCGVNPTGVEGKFCPDFEPDPDVAPIEPRKALGGGYYNGDWIPQPTSTLTIERQYALLDSHPLFTGRCPECETPIRQTDPPTIYWDCRHCGWKDDSI